MPERLEPVAMWAELREGDEIEVTLVHRGTYGRDVDVNAAGMPGAMFLKDVNGDCIYFPSWAKCSRVVRDPDLPTKPGAHILCLVDGVKNEQLARSVFTEGGRILWVVTGEPVAVAPEDIVCLHVYDEGREEEGT